jgi:beta-glucanase (GH16 family)
MSHVQSIKFFPRTMLCSSLVLLLASCGGGSSGPSSADPQAQTPVDAAAPAPLKASSPASSSAPSSASVSPYLQDASQYTLAFQDEFEGSALDKSKWNESIWYDSSASTNDYGVSNGALKIWPQRDSSGEFRQRILTTDGKYYQTYGYFEMEAKLPIGAGSWPAFWLLNSDTPDTGSPEIDIMEAYSGDQTGYWADANRHPIRYGATYFQNGANHAGLQHTFAPSTVDLSAGFHRYAVKWEPNKLSFYFDGKLVDSADVTMSRRMYILLDMQYGSASGSADYSTPTGPGNAFEINYVRAWKLK